MVAKDNFENLLDHLTVHINPNGWRVISNSTRQPGPRADELKALIQTVKEKRQSHVKRKIEKMEPPEAA
jgi:hypothetical protein